MHASMVSVKQEDKAKAVKQKPIQVTLEGNSVEEKKSEICYFCKKEVYATTAMLSKMNLGNVVCDECAIKALRIISYAGCKHYE